MHWFTSRSRWLGSGSVIFFVFIYSISLAFARQTSSDFAAKKQQADALYAQNKLEDALKIYEQLATNSEADVSIFSRLGFLLYGELSTTRDEQRRKDFADRARIALTRSRELGDQTALTNTLLSALTKGTPASTHYSENTEADAAMQQAEILYMKGELAAAIDLYKKALGEDPKLFDAALYTGDVYYKMSGKQEEAQEWFGKAVAIDPNRSIAYRYWADDLMKLGKVQEAKGKYIEAYITQPNDRLVVATLTNFAKGQNLTLSQAVVKIPVTVESDEDGYVVTVQPGAMNNANPLKISYKPVSPDGSYGASLSPEMLNNPTFMAWMKYAGSRMIWMKKYLDAHPNQRTVRNNLLEEADALRAAISQLDANSKDLDPSLATLIKLDKDGVLEAFILMARSDQGIAQDYPAYLSEHRELLRRYVVNWLFTNGGAQK